jgi:integrase
VRAHCRTGLLPVTHAGTPSVEKKKRPTLSYEAAKELLKELRGHRYYIPVLIMLMTGMRRGEVLGLRWGDIDWERGTLTIERDLVSSPEGLVFNPPKTEKSRRTISLPSSLMAELERYRQGQAEWKAQVAENYQDGDLIVAHKDGRPIRPESFTAWWNRYRKSRGLDLRIHDFRHTHATWGLQEGVNAKVMSERLGHSDIAVTLGLYSHVTEAMQQPVVEFLEERFPS